MIKRHEFKIIISSQLTKDQRDRFNTMILRPMTKMIARDWPSIRIEEIKEETVL